MRRPIIAANWKMYKTSGEVKQFMEEAAALLHANPVTVEAGESGGEVEAVICPPFTALSLLAELGRETHTPFRLGAQNMHWEENGAYTGEISPVMLHDLGVQYVIIGHSERRQYFAETDETVNKKVQSAFRHELTPIVCVGERLEERESGQTQQVLKQQVEGAINGLQREQVAQLVIAYEPVWAIGTGKASTAEDANLQIFFIREVIASLYGKEIADDVRIQYGGSVKPENMAELMAQPEIDGALVGGASLNAQSFIKLLELSGS